MNQQVPSVVTITQMAEMIDLSRSRLYSLIESGVVPKPVMIESTKRPVYVQALITQILEIKRTGVGADGTLVTFNRKRKRRAAVRATRKKAIVASDSNLTEIVAGLNSLGLNVTEPQIAALVPEHFPNVADADAGQVIRRLFLALKHQD